MLPAELIGRASVELEGDADLAEGELGEGFSNVALLVPTGSVSLVAAGSGAFLAIVDFRPRL
jgi:hypothetical protein